MVRNTKKKSETPRGGADDGGSRHDSEAKYRRLLDAFQKAFAEDELRAFIVELDCASGKGASLPLNELRDVLKESHGRIYGSIRSRGTATRIGKGGEPVYRVYIVLFSKCPDSALDSLCHLAAEAGATLDASTLAEAGVGASGDAEALWWAFVFSVLPPEQQFVARCLGAPQPIQLLDRPLLASIRALETLASDGERSATTGNRRRQTGKGRGGRRRLSGAEARRRLAILKEWDGAEGSITRREFCSSKGITIKQLENYQDWARQCRNRDR